MKASDLLGTFDHIMYFLFLFRFQRIYICRNDEEEAHLSGKAESCSFQSTQAFSRSNIPSPVRVGEILQERANLACVSGLNALLDIPQQSLLFLWADGSSRKH
jgi:hypothetical protein